MCWEAQELFSNLLYFPKGEPWVLGGFPLWPLRLQRIETRWPPTPGVLSCNTFKPCWKIPLILLPLEIYTMELIFKFTNVLQLQGTHNWLSHKIREQYQVWLTYILAQYSPRQRIKRNFPI